MSDVQNTENLWESEDRNQLKIQNRVNIKFDNGNVLELKRQTTSNMQDKWQIKKHNGNNCLQITQHLPEPNDFLLPVGQISNTGNEKQKKISFSLSPKLGSFSDKQSKKEENTNDLGASSRLINKYLTHRSPSQQPISDMKLELETSHQGFLTKRQEWRKSQNATKNINNRFSGRKSKSEESMKNKMLLPKLLPQQQVQDEPKPEHELGGYLQLRKQNCCLKVEINKKDDDSLFDDDSIKDLSPIDSHKSNANQNETTMVKETSNFLNLYCKLQNNNSNSRILFESPDNNILDINEGEMRKIKSAEVPKQNEEAVITTLATTQKWQLKVEKISFELDKLSEINDRIEDLDKRQAQTNEVLPLLLDENKIQNEGIQNNETQLQCLNLQNSQIDIKLQKLEHNESKATQKIHKQKDKQSKAYLNQMQVDFQEKIERDKFLCISFFIVILIMMALIQAIKVLSNQRD